MTRGRTNGHSLDCECPDCRTIFVHGPYGPPFETISFEEAMKRPPTPFVPPLEPTPAREFLRELDALTGEPFAPIPAGPLEVALQKIGIVNPTGHALGCPCESCVKSRAESLDKMRVRAQNGEKPETLGELLAHALRKRKEH